LSKLIIKLQSSIKLVIQTFGNGSFILTKVIQFRVCISCLLASGFIQQMHFIFNLA